MTDFAAHLVKGRSLYLPHSHVIHGQRPIGYCTVPVNAEGEVCGHPSYSEGERKRHAADCARKHASAIHAFRRRQHPEIMQSWDPELSDWMGRHKDAVLEGRMKV